ncbi:MAG: hypothetical protein A4E71_00508 [Smithella sp. PtaU1.Bin162]|nr:MAG: hypothetical protein A4E71_00508 [Smithella sp. PtaU1.Bin162]
MKLGILFLTPLFLALMFAFALAAQPENSLVVPDKVGLYLSPSHKESDLPALVLTAFAGSGCDYAGSLQITHAMKPGQPNVYTKGGRIDIWDININGYEFRKESRSVDRSCPAVITEARTVIELSEVMRNNPQLQLRIILKDRTNDFELKYYGGVVYLDPLEATNVVSWNPAENMPERPQGLGFLTAPFINQLAEIRVSGTYANNSDLAAKLRDYVRSAGYDLIDERIPGYPGKGPLDECIVFVPDGKENPDEFKIIGRIGYHEVPGGDQMIEVGLIKKKAVNPLFVRY